mmetsp:Transcript_4275/g.13330  ORF Transcript_4275/g.13330 Transcript_4275/m.13330 type:complete len:243 (-) Transcript_4275:1306-2034(-)
MPAVAGPKLFEFHAIARQSFQFGREPHGAVLGVPDVQRRDADVVAGGGVLTRAPVEENERKHAAHLRARLLEAVLAVQRNDHFAVAPGARHVLAPVLRELGVELAVVVNFPVGRHHDFSFHHLHRTFFLRLGPQRLRPALRVHDGQALVRDRVHRRNVRHVALADHQRTHPQRRRQVLRRPALRLAEQLVPRPVRPAVPQSLSALDQLRPQLRLRRALRTVENTQNPTSSIIRRRGGGTMKT